MDIGIIGLSGVGKTSFFNLLTGGKADAGYGGGRGQANIGIGRFKSQLIGFCCFPTQEDYIRHNPLYRCGWIATFNSGRTSDRGFPQ